MKKQPLHGSWLFFACFTIILLGISVFPGFFEGLPIRTEPIVDPPWYFIAQDFKEAIGAAVAAFLSFILILIYYKKYPDAAMMSLFFMLIFSGSTIGRGISILMHTEYLFEPELATTTWTTQQEYLNPWHIYGHIAYCLIVALGYHWWKRRQKNIE